MKYQISNIKYQIDFNQYEEIMLRCIKIARKGAGYVSPNPMVGCVIIKEGKIIAESYHKKLGEPHAEINAIKDAKKKGINLENAELYTNLEPCFHYGKTPPCVDEIINNKFGKVVIGTKDPNPLTSGKSIKKLLENNIKVVEGIMRNECKELNKFFLKYIQTGLPYISIKAALTLDGKIANTRHKSKWISSFESRKLVHKLRKEYDAVLIGRRTVEYDNPSLTVRHVRGRNPYRIVIDKNLKLNLNKKIFSDTYKNKTIVLASSRADKEKMKELKRRNIKIILCSIRNGRLYLKDALKKIGKLGISSILVEGGAATYSEFLMKKLVDELIIFIAPKIMRKGLDAFSEKDLKLSEIKDINMERAGDDNMLIIKLDSDIKEQ